jgi:hypothetical protein
MVRLSNNNSSQADKAQQSKINTEPYLDRIRMAEVDDTGMGLVTFLCGRE